MCFIRVNEDGTVDCNGLGFAQSLAYNWQTPELWMCGGDVDTSAATYDDLKGKIVLINSAGWWDAWFNCGSAPSTFWQATSS